MAVFNSNKGDDFEKAFEMGAMATQVKKTMKSVATTIATDVKEQVTGKYANKDEQPKENPMGVKKLPPQEAAQAEDKQKKLLEETRMNLEQLNRRIDEARKIRLQKEQEKVKVKEQEKQKKVFEMQKKEKESVEMQNIKKSGAGEILKGASG